MKLIFRIMMAMVRLLSLRQRAIACVAVLVGTVMFYAVAAVIAAVCLVLLTVALWHYLVTVISVPLAYVAVAGVYVFLLIIICANRRRFFDLRVARFLDNFVYLHSHRKK